MRLLLDLGNSRLKWACGAEPGTAWTASGSLLWSAPLAPALRDAWAGCSAPATVFAASVVDDGREAEIDAVVRECFGQAVQWVRRSYIQARESSAAARAFMPL